MNIGSDRISASVVAVAVAVAVVFAAAPLWWVVVVYLLTAPDVDINAVVLDVVVDMTAKGTIALLVTAIMLMLMFDIK
jgi:hypothetical protein